jgi:hypothetical protein
MNYSAFTETILDKILAAVALINNPEVDPEIRQLNQEILFRSVGAAVYAKVYDMNAYDFEIEHTTGPGIDDRHYGLAKVASAAVATGALGLDEYVRNFIDNTIGKAQGDAVRNARQSGKFPTVTRTESPDCCKWCRSKAGTHENPASDVFHRHGGCSGRIVTQGYRSRNGLLSNYVKPSDR